MDGWKQKLKLRLPALILLAATVLFWSFYDRYQPAGPALMDAPVLADGSQIRGDVSQLGECFRLHVPAGGPMARIDLPLPAPAAGYELIRVRCRMKTEGVVVGKHSWQSARLVLAQYDENMKWVPVRHTMVMKEGTLDWAAYENVFEPDPATRTLVVILMQGGVRGTVLFDQINAEPVRIRASFQWWRSWFAASWLFLAVVYFTRCRLHRRRLKVLILLNVIAILAGTLLPNAWISAGTAQLKLAVRDMRPAQPAPAKQPDSSKQTAAKPNAANLQKQMDWFTEMEVRSHQAGHFVLFASLCFLVYLSAALERQYPLFFVKTGGDILLFAAITESLQFLTLDRTAGLSDLRIDLYGMGLAILLFLMVLPLVRRRQVKRS